MANTQAMCNSFKSELLQGIHVFTATNPVRVVSTADTFKVALFTVGATINAQSTAYASTNEVATSGTYSAGGATITAGSGWNSITIGTQTTTTGIAYTTPTASLAWTGVTFASFDCALLYNSSQSNKAVAAYTFSAQTVTAGNFTLTMPTNAASTALLNIGP